MVKSKLKFLSTELNRSKTVIDITGQLCFCGYSNAAVRYETFEGGLYLEPGTVIAEGCVQRKMC